MSAARRGVFLSYVFITKYGLLMLTAYLYVVDTILFRVILLWYLFVAARGNFIFLYIFVKHFIFILFLSI